MRIGRTLPPAAAPLCWKNLWHGAAAIVSSGRSTRTLEDEIRWYFGVRHVFLLSSGTAALTLTLEALKSLSRATEVVIPAYTCYSVPAAVLKAGLRPVPCDINPSTFDFDDTLEQTVGADTLCVVAHHLFGLPSGMERLRAVCQARSLFLIEDAAQAMGVEVDGRKLGTFGDVGIFSLGRGKNITCGSGGIIVTNSTPIAEALARRYSQVRATSLAETLKDFVRLVLMAIFVRPRLYWIPAALPFLRLGETIFPKDVPVARLSGMKAGLLRGWRSRLAESNRIRSEITAYFADRLPLPLAQRSHPYLRLPFLANSANEKQKLYALSQARGLGLSAAYPAPVSEIPGIRMGGAVTQFPTAKRVAANLVTIPTHHLVSEQDKAAIADLCSNVRTA